LHCRRFCSGLAFCWLALCGAACAGANAPLSIDLSANVWSGDLDALIQHRAIRVLVPTAKRCSSSIMAARNAA
jgi:hypothetical protein